MPSSPAALTDTEADALFASLAATPALLLAVSGGPDSTALMVMMARWRATLPAGPRLFAATVDHGLRPQSRAEAEAVGELAARLGVPHTILQWRGEKPLTGLQAAARTARYALLAAAACKVEATLVVAAHTLDDQVETVLFRLAHGSGIAGLGGMLPVAPLPGSRSLQLARPFLGVAKARLIATLEQAGVPYAHDPTNHDPRFARPRLRRLLPLLAAEGLDTERLNVLAARARRVAAALDWMVGQLLAGPSDRSDAPAVASVDEIANWPVEIVLRALSRAIATVSGAPIALHKLEALTEAVREASAHGKPLRRTLAGAMITVARGRVFVEAAPPRRQATGDSPGRFTRND